MIIYYGKRFAGAVEKRDGQYAKTLFAHVYYLPLAPITAFWILDDRSGRGHEMRMPWRSLVAAYVRSWSILFAVISPLLARESQSVAPIIGAVVLLAVAGWTLTWRGAPGAHAQARSDLDQKAFGTRCEPRYMPPQMVTEQRTRLEARWAGMAAGQTPNDVARFGTDKPEVAVVAYGLLRITAVSLSRAEAAEAEAQASRIADKAREQLTTGEGPYRQAS